MASAAGIVEIAVRWHATLLQVARLRIGGSYRIGTASDVDLPLDLSPLTSFPLVDTTPAGFVVRCPAGVAAAVHHAGRGPVRFEGALPLARGMRIELRIGTVAIAIALVADPRVPLARRPIDRRPYLFGAASLVVQLAIVVVALSHGVLDHVLVPREITTPRRPPTTRLARPRLAPPPARRERREPARSTPSADSTPATPEGARSAGILGARSAGILGSSNLYDFSAIIGTLDLAEAFTGVGPVYDEAAANRDNFGNSAGRFDPSKDPAFDSVKTGRYATVATGRGAGAHYDLRGAVPRPPVMALTCDDGDCVVAGTMDRFAVRDVIERQYVSLVRCYERNARAIPRVELTLHFEIDPDGKVTDLRFEGLDVVGRCVARIVARARFAAADRSTQVSYPMAFWRTTP